MSERFYRNPQLKAINPENTFINIDSEDFREPYTISVENLGNSIDIKLNSNLFKSLNEKNVSAINYIGQSDNKTMYPNLGEYSQKTFISVDENYLYVWLEKSKKWKRVLLTDWE
jgi:hypothetical protein